MCSECDEREKFRTLLSMARKFLPSEQANLDTIVAECELKWKSEIDAKLASSIIMGHVGGADVAHRGVAGDKGSEEDSVGDENRTEN